MQASFELKKSAVWYQAVVNRAEGPCSHPDRAARPSCSRSGNPKYPYPYPRGLCLRPTPHRGVAASLIRSASASHHTVHTLATMREHNGQQMPQRCFTDCLCLGRALAAPLPCRWPTAFHSGIPSSRSPLHLLSIPTTSVYTYPSPAPRHHYRYHLLDDHSTSTSTPAFCVVVTATPPAMSHCLPACHTATASP